MTRELLSEVLDEDVESFNEYNQKKILNDCCPMSIYELAHKCKLWADGKGYTIQSWTFGKYDSGKAKIIGLISDFQSDDLPLINADTEPEAIFKACEWILGKDEDA